MFSFFMIILLQNVLVKYLKMLQKKKKKELDKCNFRPKCYPNWQLFQKEQIALKNKSKYTYRKQKEQFSIIR